MYFSRRREIQRGTNLWYLEWNISQLFINANRLYVKNI